MIHCIHRRHALLSRPDKPFGQFIVCVSRFPWGKISIWYQPEVDGTWYRVPHSEGEALFRQMLAAGTAAEALDILRSVN